MIGKRMGSFMRNAFVVMKPKHRLQIISVSHMISILYPAKARARWTSPPGRPEDSSLYPGQPRSRT